jgi:low affinity Fe/Cu permease
MSSLPRASVLPEIATRWAGSSAAGVVAAAAVFVLLLTGLLTGFPGWWQILVYSSGALVSMAMLFMIQHTTNRNSNAVLLKLDELGRAPAGAREEVIQVEDRQIEEQEELHDRLVADRSRSAADATADSNSSDIRLGEFRASALLGELGRRTIRRMFGRQAPGSGAAGN